MAKVIMVQGTMSGAGKSMLVAGLCRVLAQDGVKVAPFKSQNMALNSFVTEEGLEMGRAQVMQAEAAGIKPSVLMNPILLKPTSDCGSQVIVNGKVIANMKAREYFEYKKKLVPDILQAYEKLSEAVDVIVIEGAGSPAEINLKSEDIVNMGMAEMVDAPVLLVGDIDRGGVFAQLVGTMMLLKDSEKERVKGLVINKFRGDKTILDPGIEMLKDYTDVPVVGVVPYMDLVLDDEDSLTERFDKCLARAGGAGSLEDCFDGGVAGAGGAGASGASGAAINIAVVRFPRISNISDFSAFERFEGVRVNYVDSPEEILKADMVILPGSKNTLGDLKWMRERGLEAAIKKSSEKKIVFGICGGYQMLGDSIADPCGVEEGGSMRGLELLPMTTVLKDSKVTSQVTGKIGNIGGPLSALSGLHVNGYEIHMGESASGSVGCSAGAACGECDSAEGAADGQAASSLVKASVLGVDGEFSDSHAEGLWAGNVYGTYMHGFFDEGDIAWRIVEVLAKDKGLELSESGATDYLAFKESQYDKLAAVVREYMDMDAIYSILNLENK